MPSENVWTVEKDEELIEFVRTKPGLYDPKSPKYSSNHYKRQTWRQIEKSMLINGAKHRWINLRSQHRKYLAKQRSTSGKAAGKLSKWRYADQMAFLTITEHQRNSFAKRSIENNHTLDSNSTEGKSIHHSSTGDESEMFGRLDIDASTEPHDDDASSTCTSILENRRAERQFASVQPIDHFFTLMAATVKAFSPVDQHLIKIKVFQLVSEMEEKYLNPDSSSSLQPLSSVSTQHNLDQDCNEVTSQTATTLINNFNENIEADMPDITFDPSTAIMLPDNVFLSYENLG